MEVAMCAPPLCEVLSQSRGAHSVERLFGSLDVVGRQRGNCECHGEGLEQDSCRVDEFEVARIEARDTCSLVRLAVDKSFFLQHAQCLAQRSATDPEGPGEP